MSNDPVALSDISAELPQEAAYDAVYSALMATERGRKFLAEYAVRLEACRGKDSPPRSSRDLAEVAAAIARIEAELGADASPAPDALAAIDRIADIAFVLHERSVEATLCDDLDAALREISNVGAHSDRALECARNAAQMLHALGRRVAEMIAQTAARRGTDRPAVQSAADQPTETMREAAGNDVALLRAAIEDGLAPPASLFDLDAEQTENLARAVAELVASLPALADASDPALDAPVAAVEQPQLGPPAESESAPSATAHQAMSQAGPLESAATSVVGSSPTAAATLAAVRALSEEELIALFS